jgi:CAAX protease family protein
MPGWVDVALVTLFAALWPLAEYFWIWPRHVRAVERGEPGARAAAYVRTLIEEWILAGLVLALTFWNARPLATLGLMLPVGWRLALGFGLSLVYGAVILVQGRALAGKSDALARLRTKVEPLRALVPHTPAEFHRFVPLCFTAGICEELLFRGYLVWVLRAWMGLWPAAILSMILFGLAHAYQGFKFGVRAFFAGVFMGLLALTTGSILPGMALHALIDLGSGWVIYLAVRGGGAAEPAAGAA